MSIANIVRRSERERLDAGETLLKKQMKKEGSCGLRAEVAHPPLHTQTNMVQHRKSPFGPYCHPCPLIFPGRTGGGAKVLEQGVKVE